jgi:uncharacterized protein YndB with AHSA1/START domain
VAGHEVSIDIATSPGRVYALITAVDRVPEFSPECRRIVWLGDAKRPEVGARFRGTNRWRGFVWRRDVVITKVDRDREFRFETIPGRGIFNDTTRWRYLLEPIAGGTRVTERYDFVAPSWLRWMDAAIGRPRALARGMTRTLSQLKESAEAAS